MYSYARIVSRGKKKKSPIGPHNCDPRLIRIPALYGRHATVWVPVAWRACKNSLHGFTFAFAFHLQRNGFFSGRPITEYLGSVGRRGGKWRSKSHYSHYAVEGYSSCTFPGVKFSTNKPRKAGQGGQTGERNWPEREHVCFVLRWSRVECPSGKDL